MRGDSPAQNNMAASYRILGKLRLATKWFKKAAESGDGDAMADWAYCLQHGAGIRRDERLAERVYRRAIGHKSITEADREEAMYHLAVLLIRRGSAQARRAATKLLERANVDGDFPQAQTLLEAIQTAAPVQICVCRRYLRPSLGRRFCPLHGRMKKRSTSASQARRLAEPAA
jgi:TPR repeat protein